MRQWATVQKQPFGTVPFCVELLKNQEQKHGATLCQVNSVQMVDDETMCRPQSCAHNSVGKLEGRVGKRSAKASTMPTSCM